MQPTQLLDAAECGDSAAALSLLQSGASASAASSTGETALMKAARGGHPDVVQCLLSHGALAETRESINGSSALMLAAAAGHSACVAHLLAAHASPSETDANGRSPLLNAATNGHDKALALLLGASTSASGADVADEAGRTPLIAAASAGALACVELCLAASASIYARDVTDATALHVAAQGGHLDVAHALLRAGARADVRDTEGNMPVDVATDDSMRDVLAAALDDQYEHFSEKSYDSAQDDRPWH